MKKKLIAAGAASLAVAAMPVVGVFATPVITSNNTVVDHIQLTVDKTCQMVVDSTNATAQGTEPNVTYVAPYGGTYDLGTSTVAHVFDGTVGGDGADPIHAAGGIQGTPMTLTCNGLGPNNGNGIGWNLSATTTALSRDLGQGNTDPYAIPFGAFVSSGTDSVWSAKLNLSVASGSSIDPTADGFNWGDYADITTGWDNWASTTNGDTTILTGEANASVDGLVVTPAYKAYGAAKQPVGTYYGSITYTFHDLTTD